jgi:hypothetical protein
VQATPEHQLGGADRIDDDWDFLVDMLCSCVFSCAESHGTWTQNKDLDKT